MNTLTNGQIFLYETLGTAMLLLLGCGVVATAILRDSKGFGGGWLLINFGWGLGVYMGVYVAFPSGAHLNPAVTVSQLIMGNVTAGQAIFYFLGEFLGAFLGAVLAWVAFKQHFDLEEDAGAKLAVFSTAPGHPLVRLEPRHRDHRHLRADLPHPHLRRHAHPGRPAVRGAGGGRDRQLARWPHRVRHQPGP